jgi:hypothetical protein
MCGIKQLFGLEKPTVPEIVQSNPAADAAAATAKANLQAAKDRQYLEGRRKKSSLLSAGANPMADTQSQSLLAMAGKTQLGA